MMSKQKRTLALSVTLLLILSALFMGGARIASAAFQTPDSGMPFVSAVFQSGNLDNRQTGEVDFSGEIQAVSQDSWTIGGLVVHIQPGTEIKGSFIVGDQVKVHVFRDANGELFAQEIGPFTASAVELTNDNVFEGYQSESMGEDNANSNDDNSNGTISENNNNEVNVNESITNSNSNANSNDDNSNSSISEDDDNGNEGPEDDHGNGNGNNHDDDHAERRNDH
jgi:hypothetical protein